MNKSPDKIELKRIEEERTLNEFADKLVSNQEQQPPKLKKMVYDNIGELLYDF